MRTRNKSIPIRVTEKELEAIDEAAKKAKKKQFNFFGRIVKYEKAAQKAAFC